MITKKYERRKKSSDGGKKKYEKEQEIRKQIRLLDSRFGCGWLEFVQQFDRQLDYDVVQWNNLRIWNLWKGKFNFRLSLSLSISIEASEA